MRSACSKLARKSRPRSFATNESAFNQPAAIASSGLRSITQKKNLPPFRRTNIEPRKEISGGEVKATTTSNRGSSNNLNEQVKRKLAKFVARRHFAFFPSASEGIRMILIPFQFSRRGKRLEGSSYPRSLAITVTLFPSLAIP